MKPERNPRRAASALAPANAGRTLSICLLFCGAWLLGGTACSLIQAKPDAMRYYLLSSPVGGAKAASNEGPPKRMSLGLRRVELPAYLRTPSIVLRPGGTEMRAAPAARWGEPLDQGIGRVLKLALAAQPPVQSVVVYPAPAAETPAFEITLTVLACEGIQTTAGGTARFVADWELNSTGPGAAKIAQGHFAPPVAAWDGSDYAALTARLGETVAALAPEIVAALPK